MGTSSDATFSFGSLWWVLFIAIKVGGTSLVSWSWWWLLLPIVPLLSLLIKKAGL